MNGKLSLVVELVLDVHVFFFLMFNAAELLAAIGPLGWLSHCKFHTINWPTVNSSLNDFLHTKPGEGFTLDPLGRDTNLMPPWLSGPGLKQMQLDYILHNILL